MNHTEYMRGPRGRERARKQARTRECLDRIKWNLLVVVAVALFLGAMHADHQYLMATI